MLSQEPTRTSIYSPSLKKWLHHAYVPDHDLKLYPITPITTVVPSTYTTSTNKHHNLHTRRWWSRYITQDVPEMGAALGFIDKFLKESHVVETHAELLDPSVGSLLAFGRAADEHKSTRLIDTALYAMGPIGADLGAGTLAHGYIELKGAKGVGVDILKIEGAGQIAEFGNRIKQVCVAGKRGVGESKTNVAIRTAVSTTIFRQDRLSDPLPGRATRFTANRLLNIDTSETGEAAHAHVEFNPWYERQFATINECGKWRIYDIGGQQRRGLPVHMDLTVEECASGSISSEDGTGGGWGRIVWGGDMNSVIACDRKGAGLFDIRSSPSIGSDINIPVDQGFEQGWILDLQRGPSLEAYPYDAFILTASALTWVDMRQSRKPLVSTPHYRHNKDTSLSMDLFNINESTINALIYSRLNHLITSYRFSPNENKQFPTFLGDPSMIPGLTPHDVKTPVSFGLNVLPCSLKQRGELDEKGEEYLADEDLRFFTGFGVGPDLEITQRMYCNKEGFQLMKKGRGHAGLWEAKSTYGVAHEEDETTDYGSNNPNASSEDNHDSLDSAVTTLDTKNKSKAKKKSIIGHRRIRRNFGALYTYAFKEVAPYLRTATEGDPKDSVTAFTEYIKDILSTRLARGDLGIISLMNLRQPDLLYDRLEGLQASIKNLFLRDESLRPYQILSLILPNSDEFFIPQDPVGDPDDLIMASPPFPSQISIQPLYNMLISSWVSPLPEKTPGKIRLHRERICRMVASEIWLASIGVNLEPKPESLPPPPPPPQDADPNIPPAPPEPEPLMKIRTYANVSTRIVLPEGMSNILGKWDVGEDPWEYEYIPGEQSGISKRRRHHRRKSGFRKGDAVNRLRGDVENWKIGSQPPTIAVAPQLASSQFMGSSQVQGSSQIDVPVMSQVERGNRGGRTAVRKKRKTGF